jgi:hypothetical protein
MGFAWHEISALRRSAVRWGSTLGLAVAVGCGGDRDGAPDTGGESVATADTAGVAAPAPDTADTAGVAAPPADTAAASKATSADTGTRPAPAAAPKPTPTPATAAEPPAPKPSKPAPAPAPAAADTAPKAQAPAPAPPAPSRDTAASAQGTTQTAQETAPQPMRDEYHQAPKDTVDQATYNGWKQYNLNCARCHGEDVLGTTIAPHLILSLKPDGPIPTQESFVQVVCAGRPEKGMPAWCALGMDPAKINEIFAYVKGRSEAKIGPGRPALREGS